MQEPIIPFLPPTFGSFMGLIAFFFLFGIFINFLQQYGCKTFSPAATFDAFKKIFRREPDDKARLEARLEAGPEAGAEGPAARTIVTRLVGIWRSVCSM